MLRIFKKAEILLTTDSFDSDSQTTHVEQRRRPGSILHVAQASVQVIGERAYQRTATKIRDWRKNIILNERKRLRRTAIDMWVIVLVTSASPVNAVIAANIDGELSNPQNGGIVYTMIEVYGLWRRTSEAGYWTKLKVHVGLGEHSTQKYIENTNLSFSGRN